MLHFFFNHLFIFSQDSLRSQNLSTGRRLQRLEKVSDAMKGQMEAFTLKQGSKPMTSL